MAITIELPEELERELLARPADVDARVAIALAIAMYQSGSIPITRFAKVLREVVLALDADEEVESAEAAAFHFSPADHERYQSLASRTEEQGGLTPADRLELAAFVDADSAISSLRPIAMTAAAAS